VDYLDVEYYSASSEIELRGWVCLWDLEERGVKRILQAVFTWYCEVGVRYFLDNGGVAGGLQRVDGIGCCERRVWM